MYPHRCTHTDRALLPDARPGGYMRVVCPTCGLQGPWRKGFVLTAIRAFWALARRQKHVLGAKEYSSQPATEGRLVGSQVAAQPSLFD